LNELSDLTLALEAAWRTIRGNHPDVPPVLLVVAPAERSRKGGIKLGHFATRIWENESGERIHEVLLVAEQLRRPANEVFTTLLHESIHGLADARGVKDTSRQNRYHNKRFVALAQEVGMEYVHEKPHPTIGFSAVTLKDETVDQYESTILALGESLKLWRASVDTTDTATSTAAQAPAECCCEPPRLLRVSNKELEAGDIVCATCRCPFSRDSLIALP
jgi:hypothetical protein